MAVIGDMLALGEIVGPLSTMLRSEDFHSPMCGDAFAALVDAHKRGERHDPTSLVSAMRELGREPDNRWMTEVLSRGSGAWRRHADTVLKMHARRSVIAAIGEAAADVRELDPFDVIDTLKGRLTAISRPTSQASADLWQLDDFLDHADHAETPWVVPGLLKREWRVVVVAGEGVGKSMLWRQFAVLSAQGIHPLCFYTFDPVRTLLVDLENPVDAITKSCRSLRAGVNQDLYERGRAWIWHRPAGVDLRSRATRAEFEANLAAARPDLVCLGPLYKAYSRKGGETDEDAAREVQECLDDLRTRYGFALLLEHHAPQEQGGHRTMRPYGSSLWLRWPEIGIGMEQLYPNTEQRDVELKRWRGDRLHNQWPKTLQPGLQWPWVAPA